MEWVILEEKESDKTKVGREEEVKAKSEFTKTDKQEKTRLDLKSSLHNARKMQ